MRLIRDGENVGVEVGKPGVWRWGGGESERERLYTYRYTVTPPE